MQVLTLLSASALLTTFSLALVAKARDFRAFRDSLSSFGFPSGVHNLIVIATLGTETLAIVALLATPLRWAGIIFLGLLSAFSVASALAMLRGRKPQCQCFGNLTSGSIGKSTIMRNTALAACAVVLLTEGRSLPGVIRSMDSQILIVSFMALVIAGLLALTFDLLRRYGEVLHMLEVLGVDHTTHQNEFSFQPGERLPEVKFSGWNRHPVSLLDETRGRASKALVLLSTTCGNCDELIPALEGAAVQGLPGVVVIYGKSSSNGDRLQGVHNRGWPVLSTEAADFTTRFRIAGFPALVPLDEQGNAKGGTLLGRHLIESFLTSELRTRGSGVESEQEHD